ncbi:MAG: AAA family ATPase [Deltaproteobacteria bacterium]|nr:AAA family ATPase [Deltaproteobacteria bacterium]
MHCASCQSDNPEGAKFCIECGTPLKPRCAQCGNENLARAKFCSECGTALSGKAKVKNSQHPAPSNTPPLSQDSALRTQHSAAERRQLTVMFCDLVGSTALSDRLDPEELRAVVQEYQTTCAAVIERYEGYIAQYLGDGLLVYFGYPTAHEDDAQRAVKTGLEIIQKLQERVPSPLVGAGQGEGAKLNTLHTPHPNLLPQGEKELRRLQVRIGIHTGLVVVGEIGGGARREQLALGDTPNIAARLQGLAIPDTIVISETTHRLVQDQFEQVALGAQVLKGIAAPMQVYCVQGERERLEEFAGPSSSRLTPLVGREHELGMLLNCWKCATEGDGQVTLLSGEAGIGKSRLMQVLRERALSEGATRIEFRCSPYHRNSAWHPLIEHLHRLLHFQREDSLQTKLEKLQQTLSRYRFLQEDTVPLLAALLSLPHPEGFSPLQLTPQRQKQKTQEVLLSWLFEETDRAPVYCVWEDLHRADPSTLDLLQRLIDQLSTTRMFLLLTFRPEFIPPWSSRSYVSQITLSRLGRAQVPTMVERLTKGKTLPPEVLQQIVDKTDGVPLFVEELTKMVLESGLLQEGKDAYTLTGSLPPLAIPATLHDSLMARLDRLATVREIAQVGAALGREFSHELLQAVLNQAGSNLDEESLRNGLQQLVDAELLYRQGQPPHATYLFKHALIRDTAYQSLLKSRRQQIHTQIARVLEERFAEVVATQPEVVAHHYTEAGLVPQAVLAWQQAGQQAIERSAEREAISHLTTGLALLRTLPDTIERAAQELTLLVGLGPALMAIKGYAAAEVTEVYAQAHALSQRVGDTPELFPALLGLATSALIRGEFRTAHDLGEQLLHFAQREQDSALLVEAHYILGTTLFHLGELAAARQHLEQGIALYDFQQHRFLAFRYGQDPGVFCLCYLTRILWFLGYPDQALHQSRKAVALATELKHPFSSTLAATFAAVVAQLRREETVTLTEAATAIALSTEHSFAFYLAMSTMLRGWALTFQGRPEEGLQQLQQGLAAWQATGAELFRPHVLALLAEAYGATARNEEGLRVVADALNTANTGGTRFYEAELHRRKGELLLTQEGLRPQAIGLREKTEEAEQCFLRAIEIAQRQHAKSWELRATTSLARLWQRQSKRQAAHALLSEVYCWFTEGLDTKDLQEARALLAELSQESH